MAKRIWSSMGLTILTLASILALCTQSYPQGIRAVATGKSYVIDVSKDGGAAVASLERTTWVETTGDDSTGEVGIQNRPFLTINAALDALGPNGGTVMLGHGSFAAPATGAWWNGSGVFTTTTSKIRDNTRIIGAGMPQFNSENTALEGNGTIIQGGMIIDNNGVWVENLGVDCGSSVCTASFSGVAQEGLLFANIGQVAAPGTKAPRVDCGARNIRVLIAAADSARHATLFENVDGFRAENISTRFGFAGTVIKAINSTFSGIVGSGHSAAALYIKSNAYAPCHNNTVNGVVMTAISGTGQGIRITTEDPSSPELTDIQITGAIANGVTTGVQWIATNASIKRVRIDVRMTGVTNAFTRSGALEEFTCFTNGVSLRTTPHLLKYWVILGVACLLGAGAFVLRRALR